ncbi:MAG: 3-oxoacyl-[acyl-carrier protein] reductase, partial [Porticoccaceae bacterium]
MDLQLSGKTALVTGASAGIGRGIAKALAAEGVKIIIAARRKEVLNELAKEIEGEGNPVPIVIASDLYDENASVNLAAEALAAVGHIDILINNAGGSRPFADLHVDEER